MVPKNVSLASVLALASTVGAHILLKTPVPYGAATLNTNPLVKDGSDYPWYVIPNVLPPIPPSRLHVNDADLNPFAASNATGCTP